MADKIADE